MQVFLAICGSGLFAALAAIFAPILLEKVKYRHAKQTKADADKDKFQKISDEIKDVKTSQEERMDKLETSQKERIDKLETYQKERMDRIEEKLEKVTGTTDALVTNEIARTYVLIRRTALYAIKKGEIGASDLEKLLDEYARYKKLPNANGFLEETMATVKTLRVIVDDGDLDAGIRRWDSEVHP